MTATLFQDVSNQVQKFWAPVFMDEFKETSLLAGLVNKDYEGTIGAGGGDTVYVSQINRPAGNIGTLGVDSSSFNTTKLSMSRVAVVADKRISAAYEFEDLAVLMSQLKDQDSKIRRSLLEATESKLNDHLYTKLAPKSPSHVITAVTDFNATALGNARVLAAKANWPKIDPWWVLSSPQYYQDLLNATTLTSKDYVEGEAPVVGGQIVNRRFGFSILEDTSAGLSTLHTDDAALIFHPDFLHLVMGQPTFDVAPLVSNKQFGYILVVNFWCGAALGIDGDSKHITVIGS